MLAVFEFQAKFRDYSLLASRQERQNRFAAFPGLAQQNRFAAFPALAQRDRFAVFLRKGRQDRFLWFLSLRRVVK